MNGDTSRPIQVFPNGLLGFLQLKNTGKNPGQMPDMLSITWDALDWYLKSRSEIITLSGSTIATGFKGTTAAFTVPAGEAWYVHAQTVEVFDLAAATDILFVRAHHAANPIVGEDLDGPQAKPSLIVPNSAIAMLYDVIATDGGFFLNPGSRMGLLSQGCVFAASPKNVLYFAEITRLPL